MNRVPNWDIRLVEFVESVRGRPFEWGETDCASLALGAITAMYGENVLPLPGWACAGSALRVSRAVGAPWRPLRDIGAKPVRRTMAQSGDVVLTAGEDPRGLPQVAVVVHGLALVSTPEDGVRLVRLSEVARPSTFWRVPVDGPLAPVRPRLPG